MTQPVFRNTGWVIGLVLFTGEDTKIVLNSGGTPSKRSRVERQMNPQVFINLALLAVIATVCAIVDSTLEKKYYPRNAPWLFADDQKDNNPRVNGLITWAFALIVFQNIVPISLYISIEGVRTLQAAFIYFDSEIWYKKLNQPTLARSWNLSDDLGQIEYIFSDKTGTLTQVCPLVFE
jgi:phospholipid-translocating ATPase